jgi:hypothetical protein
MRRTQEKDRDNPVPGPQRIDRLTATVEQAGREPAAGAANGGGSRPLPIGPCGSKRTDTLVPLLLNESASTRSLVVIDAKVMAAALTGEVSGEPVKILDPFARPGGKSDGSNALAHPDGEEDQQQPCHARTRPKARPAKKPGRGL